VATFIANLPHRGVLEIQGEDKRSFLQGLITNDINLVSPKKAIYATLLTPQGRFLYDFFITEKDGSFFLDAEAGRLEALIKKLSLYKLRSQVTLTPRSDLKVYAVWGDDVAPSLGLKNETGHTQGGTFMDPRLLDLGARIIGEGMANTTEDAYDLHRLKLGVPEGGLDLIPEKSILLESGLDELNAISWTKGCYMGQELTARTKHVGEVRKRLYPIEIEGDIPDEETEILNQGTPVGTLRSKRGSYGLALLRSEATEGELTCGKARLKVGKCAWK
jgi:folate-binding protein YgfZ